MSKKKNCLCWACLRTIARISGYEISTCREGGLVHDFVPTKIANDFPIRGSVSDLMLAPTSLPLEETIQALVEIQEGGELWENMHKQE